MTAGSGAGAAGQPHRVPVLVAAAGAAWEAEALDRMERAAPAVVLSRRCVDLTDLLATAATGLATVAVVAPGLPGLDADSVDALRRCGVATVLVAAPTELEGGGSARLQRLGVGRLLPADDLAGLVPAITTAASPPAHDSPGGTGEPTAVTDPETTAPARPEPRRGRLVAVWGAAGAPGRTTVAVALATEMARAGTEVLLLDADPYGGAVAQHLGVLDEVSGLLAAVRAANSGLLDTARLAGLARQAGERLRLLSGLPRADRWQEVRPAAYDDLLHEAVRLADVVVADLGFSLEGDPGDLGTAWGSAAPRRNLTTLATLARADEVVVVGSADPVGLARLARGLVELRDVLPGVRPRVVVNRTRPTLGWSDREISGMVEGFVRPLDVHFLPEDRAAADRALMGGLSLAECGESPLRDAAQGLADGVLGRVPAPRPRGGARVGAGLRLRRAGRAR